jgi:hypothetical protein
MEWLLCVAGKLRVIVEQYPFFLKITVPIVAQYISLQLYAVNL